MNNNQNNTYHTEEDEIDLRELFLVLKKRKITIFLVTTLITTLAIVYALLKTPTYEVKSNVQLGFIGKNLIDNSETIKKVLNVVFNVEDQVESPDAFVSKVQSINTNKILPNFLTITTEAISNKEALKKNKEVITFLQEMYINRITQQKHLIEKNIENDKRSLVKIDTFEKKNIEEQIKQLRTQDVAKIEEKINYLKNFKLKSIQTKTNLHKKKLLEYTESVNALYKKNQSKTDSATLTIASIQMLNYQNLILNVQTKIEDLKTERKLVVTESIPDLQREKDNILNNTIRKLENTLNVELATKKIELNNNIDTLKYKLTPAFVQNSRVIGQFVIHDYPTKPKKKLVIVVGFITSLIISIFLVFFLEFIQGVKKEEQSK